MKNRARLEKFQHYDFVLHKLFQNVGKQSCGGSNNSYAKINKLKNFSPAKDSQNPSFLNAFRKNRKPKSNNFC